MAIAQKNTPGAKEKNSTLSLADSQAKRQRTSENVDASADAR
jgi:hypothetical protein